MMNHTSRGWTRSALLAAFLLVAAGADGTSTQVWEVGTFEEFAAGTFEGTQLESTGEVTMGLSTLRAEIPETASVWSSIVVGDDVLLGTGNTGALWMLRGDKLVKLTETDSVVISALATDGDGTLFAGALPGAKIWRFDSKKIASFVEKAGKAEPMVKWEPGHGAPKKDKKKDKKKADDKGDKKADDKGDKKADDKGDKKADDKGDKSKGPKPWVELEDAEHVWALVYDQKKKLLYAGTGPEGIVYAVDPSGHATVVADTDEEHIMSLALAGDGALLAGTGNHAKLLRIEGPGRVETVWDFEGTEVKAISLVDIDGKDEPAVVVAVNTFKTPPSFTVKMPSMKDLTAPSKGGSNGLRIPDGEGLVAAILPDGGYRELLQEKKTHFSAMSPVEGGVQVSTGAEGRVVEVDLEGNNTVLLDVEERQVLTFNLVGTAKVVGTADPACVHRIQAKPPSDPYYLSKVHDAGFTARWGRMVLRGEGPLWWQTRSGNTIEPDETWSSWSAALTTQEAVISSPAARFLQFRLKVGGTTRVWNVQAFYLPHNQQAIITEVTVGDDPKAKSTSKAKAAVKSPDPKIPIKWKTDNADGDELRYELWFALEAEGQWIAILDQGEILTKAEYSWDTTAVPSGWYVVKVGASDGGVNDPSMASTHALESRAFLVDNDPPKVTLKAKSAKTEVALSGTVVDDFSEISSIEYSMDGGPWQTLFPEDLIFDEISESFSHTVAGLEAGSHTVTVRGTDRVGNGTSAGAHFTIK